MTSMKRRDLLALAIIAAFGAAPALAADDAKNRTPADGDTFDQDTVLHDAEAFFGKGAEGLGKVIEKAFKENGRPNGYIKGQEAAGAITVGLIYGDGTLVLKNAKSRRVFWSGPSIGFDLGANASKVFVLVYNMKRSGRDLPALPGGRRQLLLRRRRRHQLPAPRRHHARADPARRRPARGREHRLRPLHADEDLQPVLMRYRLYYWPEIQGRGEFVRLALEYAGADYVDVLRTSGDSTNPEVKRTPFAPPYLVAGKLVIAQTANILLYLGPRLRLAPKDEAGRLWAHQLQLTIADWLVEVHDTHHPIGSGLYYEEQRREARRRAADFRAHAPAEISGLF